MESGPGPHCSETVLAREGFQVRTVSNLTRRRSFENGRTPETYRRTPVGLNPSMFLLSLPFPIHSFCTPVHLVRVVCGEPLNGTP